MLAGIYTIFNDLLLFLSARFAFKAVYFAYRSGVFLLFLTLFVSVVTAFVNTYSSVVSSLQQSVPEIVSGVWGWVMPSNFSLLVLSVITVYIARFLFRIMIRILQFKYHVAQQLGK